MLGPAHLGVLASLGLDRGRRSCPRPRVGVLSTGDELREGPVELAPGQIRDSNRPMLLAMLARRGLRAGRTSASRATTRRSSSARSTTRLTRCDALITSGGVSVGDYDVVKAVLDRLGVLQWWQVAIKPAKPFAFGLLRGVPLFGLPGNPVSSHVSFELFARPALRAMMGHRRAAPARSSTRSPARRCRADRTASCTSTACVVRYEDGRYVRAAQRRAGEQRARGAWRVAERSRAAPRRRRRRRRRHLRVMLLD